MAVFYSIFFHSSFWETPKQIFLKSLNIFEGSEHYWKCKHFFQKSEQFLCKCKHFLKKVQITFFFKIWSFFFQNSEHFLQMQTFSQGSACDLYRYPPLIHMLIRRSFVCRFKEARIVLYYWTEGVIISKVAHVWLAVLSRLCACYNEAKYGGL